MLRMHGPECRSVAGRGAVTVLQQGPVRCIQRRILQVERAALRQGDREGRIHLLVATRPKRFVATDKCHRDERQRDEQCQEFEPIGPRPWAVSRHPIREVNPQSCHPAEHTHVRRPKQTASGEEHQYRSEQSDTQRRGQDMGCQRRLTQSRREASADRYASSSVGKCENACR